MNDTLKDEAHLRSLSVEASEDKVLHLLPPAPRVEKGRGAVRVDQTAGDGPKLGGADGRTQGFKASCTASLAWAWAFPGPDKKDPSQGSRAAVGVGGLVVSTSFTVRTLPEIIEAEEHDIRTSKGWSSTRGVEVPGVSLSSWGLSEAARSGANGSE